MKYRKKIVFVSLALTCGAIASLVAVPSFSAEGEPPRRMQFPPVVAPTPDPFAANARVFVLTDMGNEPDDQMSFVRLLLYANEIGIEGMAATTSVHMANQTNPQTMRGIVEAYGEVRPNLLRHAPGWPARETLDALITSGPKGYGMAAVNPRAPSSAAVALIQAADRPDVRPLWISIWGGANTLAEALQVARQTRTPQQMDAFVSRLRVYSISDQDDAGPWIRREFPALFYVVSPSLPNADDYPAATWTGISGERYYLQSEGADFTKVSNEWLDVNIRKGPLGTHYPKYAFIMEGDTPSFLGLVPNGLNSAMSPAWGGWGGRYFYRRVLSEVRPIWTQGGGTFGGANSRDSVTGLDGQTYVSDQATIWRWRDAYQNDFAARMDWTIKPPGEANHRPIAVVNGDAAGGPLILDVQEGADITLEAGRSRDPDAGQSLSYRWFHYREAGAGLGQPLAEVELSSQAGDRTTVKAISACRVRSRAAATCSVGVAHVVLEIRDDGSPQLTSYRRVVVQVHR